MQTDVDFTWWRERNRKDYEEVMVEARREQPSFVDQILRGKVPRIVPKRVRLESYKPLEQFPDLFARFAKLQSQEDVIEFVRTFGPLTEEGLTGKGDNLFTCFETAKKMGAGNLWYDWPACTLAATLVRSRDGVSLKVEPACLLDALWFQFAQAVSKRQANRCRECKELFATGPDAKRRKGAEFCSVECKTRYHSLKRSR
jgi:hypothetical protein